MAAVISDRDRINHEHAAILADRDRLQKELAALAADLELVRHDLELASQERDHLKQLVDYHDSRKTLVTVTVADKNQFFRCEVNG